MSFWRDHGSSVLMMAGLWLIFSDPIPGWLPVPMPELVPGPETTWEPNVVIVEGRPNYAAIVDAERSDRLAALKMQTGRYLQLYVLHKDDLEIVISAAARQWRAGKRIMDRLAGDYRDALPGDDAQTRAHALSCARAIAGADGPQRIALALTSYTQEATESMLPVGSASHLLIIQAMGSALWASMQEQRNAGAISPALDDSLALVRLGRLATGSDDVFGLALAVSLQADGLWSGAQMIAETRNGANWRSREAEKLLAVPVADIDAQFLYYTRLFMLRMTIDGDHGIRSGSLREGMLSTLRVNYPPDINRTLRMLNAKMSMVQTLVPPTTDPLTLVEVNMPQLFVQVGSHSEGENIPPLANRILFQESVHNRREAASKMLTAAGMELVTLGLITVRTQSARIIAARQVLQLLADPSASTSAAAVAEHLQQGYSALPADVRPHVTVSASTVIITLPQADDTSGPSPLQPLHLMCEHP